MTKETEIRQILATIPDPEIPVISLDELGMIRDIHVQENAIRITITPTYSGCPAVQQIRDDIRNLLEEKGYHQVEVMLSYSPAWNTKMMNPASMQKLKDYGIAPPQHCCGNELCSSGKCSKVICPHCNSRNTDKISEFGSTACKALYTCKECLEPFEYFKPLV
jgi:ring-1,2-phenylacetyl-CoA epoxidase subunit PaaD